MMLAVDDDDKSWAESISVWKAELQLRLLPWVVCSSVLQFIGIYAPEVHVMLFVVVKR